ncbi:hypothetical protein HZC08_01960, partial [Candidatus Micrarchaeota archaeon]|nr:hypothetical protein [Candidatus Micrarchaeota archaeon]
MNYKYATPSSASKTPWLKRMKLRKSHLLVPLVAGIIGGVAYHEYIESTRIRTEEITLENFGKRDLDEMRHLSGHIRKRLRINPQATLKFNKPGKILYRTPKGTGDKELKPGLLTPYEKQSLIKLNRMQIQTNHLRQYIEEHRDRLLWASIGNGFWTGFITATVLLLASALKLLKKPKLQTCGRHTQTIPKPLQHTSPEVKIERHLRPDRRLMRRLLRLAGRLRHMRSEVITEEE